MQEKRWGEFTTCLVLNVILLRLWKHQPHRFRHLPNHAMRWPQHKRPRQQRGKGTAQPRLDLSSSLQRAVATAADQPGVHTSIHTSTLKSFPMPSTPYSLRTLLAAGLLSLATLGPAVAADDEVTMFKDPNCGCCGKWAEHMRANGFSVKEIASREMDAVKRQAGVPQALGSCHTAKVGGYVVEGHVPAADVKRMLAQKPAVTGLSAPGMPQGSPGMEGPYPADRYDVVSFDAEGRSAVFASH